LSPEVKIQALVTIKNLSIRYKSNSHFSVRNFNCEIFKGDMIVITGRNGCGKSTIFKAIARVFPKGSLAEIDGSISFHSKFHVGMTFQRPKSQILTFQVMEELATSLNFSKKPSQRRERKRIVEEMIVKYSLESKKYVDPRFLSSGEQQKLITIATIIAEPGLLLLDEPISLLDDDNRKIVINTMKELNSKGFTIVITDPSFQISNDSAFREVRVESEHKIVKVLPEAKSDFSNAPRISYQIDGLLGYNTTYLSMKLQFKNRGLIIIQGSNGSGKSLILKTFVKIVKMIDGSLSVPNFLYLDQDSYNFFYHKSIKLEWGELGLMPSWIHEKEDLHPFTLSEGEQKLLSLEIAFRDPRGLLLDEPSKSLDTDALTWLSDSLQTLSKSKLIIVASNDLRFINEIISDDVEMWNVNEMVIAK